MFQLFVILESTQALFPATSVQEVEDIIPRVIKYSLDRQGGRDYRRRDSIKRRKSVLYVSDSESE